MAHPSPLRVLVIVSQRSSLFATARDSSEGLIPLATRLLRRNTLLRMSDPKDTRLLAVQKWRTRIFLVFDIANTDYDAMLGHLPEHNQLPVVVAHFSKKKSAYSANPWIARRVNHDIAMLHNANGFNSVPPFMEDHSLGKTPAYHSPRDISVLRVTYI
ncbi:hypothetical protein N7448_007328 [Penicillium atrosanguineum]|uniref:Uncharacterized protein n=1 Tax=Penicillium atrosanguineum TaxID=1132637 RepID=A0A9W9QE90_9EURO|nr:uncharacterized protein N7443_001642 [Penicillium atrosanguineum]KAJ5126549.1 hypothetical protein N7448_007328 [Penicillium atrosanguineum]KAJ5146752.1 hypothetical protein N7526_000104 [Penicillium atrosanguineum]KAJ5314758.1 hypothetical protein N7443_001642 [Penicillium atrosanguineum]KAJ5331930.1 hypothetical protein N7476_001713 [Penicillium atrosanguineum]